MRFWVILSAIAILPSSALATEIPEHLDWAQRLVDTVTPTTNTYGDPAQITWSSDNGLGFSTNRTKCASLVTQLLERAYNPDFMGWLGCTSPHAASYHDAIKTEDGFERIDSINEIEVGDIIAIRYFDAGCKNLTCGTFQGCTTSGHVAMVAGIPKLRSATKPIIANTTQYAVDIIDSSTSYHGTSDTRYHSDVGNGDDQGVGRGTMRLYVDTTNSVIGYSWSTSSGSIYYSYTTRDLVIGRY